MEVFKWVRISLVVLVCIIGFRIFAAGFEWHYALVVTDIAGMVVVSAGFILGVIGILQDQKSFINRKLAVRRSHNRK